MTHLAFSWFPLKTTIILSLAIVSIKCQNYEDGWPILIDDDELGQVAVVVPRPQAGVIVLPGLNSQVPFVRGDEKARLVPDKTTFPWMVIFRKQIRLNDLEMVNHCTGTIINKRWIVSAATCFDE